MKCPECGSKTEVTRSFELPGYRIRRYRRCPQCQLHFMTTERITDNKTFQFVPGKLPAA